MSGNDTDHQVDGIVRRIRAKLEARRGSLQATVADPSPTLPLLPVDFNHIAVPLRAADERWQRPAVDGRRGGLRRRVASVVARFLRRIDHGAVAQQEAFNAATMQTLAACRDALEVTVRNVNQLNEQLAVLTTAVARQQAHAAAAASVVAALPALQAELAECRAAADTTRQQMAALHADTATLAKRAQAIERRTQAYSELHQRVTALASRVEARTERQEPFLKPPDEPRAMDDSLYVALENRFRGSRQEIQARASIYLPSIEKAAAGVPNRPVIDLGCGRGEWLELLKARRLEARGVDLNREMVKDCQAKGLDVTCADLVCYLSHLPDESVGAVFALHVIEHLSLASWADLLDHTLRVLQPGGVAILETPNPENVLVGAHAFYLDPTHRNPVPSPTLSFLVEQQGFADVTVLPLHPVPHEQHVKESTEVAARFNHYFYGPLDYAVVGWKR